MFFRSAPTQVTPADALAGRDDYPFTPPTRNVVLGTPLTGPWPDGMEVLYLGMGCFWGAEKKLWAMPGVYSTAVGYQGGYTPHPTYEEVCSGRTGHAENVQVVYDPNVVSTYDILKVFWENHDPTQGYRQGNDVGTQYRSAVYWTTPEQEKVVRATRDAYDEVLQAAGLDPITTELDSAGNHPFYLAEPHHQQYLSPTKNPHGYDCHAHTGYLLPPA